MTFPEISVIVPVYNTSEYLVQCLDTIVNQTFRNIEIICVNDGSTDGSTDILNEFSSKDYRIIIVERKSASGSAACPRNAGLDIARGKYVMFLDSDDYFDICMLEKLLTHAEKTEADLVMCDNSTVLFYSGKIDDRNTELHYKYLPELRTFSYMDIPDTIFQISNAAVWHKLILRETITKHNLRFQLDVPSLDDVYFVNLLLVLSKRISIIRDRLIFYRSNRYGAQTTEIEKHKDSVFLAFSELNKYLIEHSLYETVKFSLQNWTLATMAWWLSSIGKHDVFNELYSLYKNEYFDKLGLMNIAPETLYDNLGRFYSIVLEREIEPSPRVVLESILKPGSRIAVYGAGFVGNNIYEMAKIQGKHDIILWCDSNADKLGNPLVKYPKELMFCDLDAVIIAIANDDAINEVKEYLNEIGIDSEKVYTV
jgi:glycosyltransferase involved in cell wall biosynthesis